MENLSGQEQHLATFAESEAAYYIAAHRGLEAGEPDRFNIAPFFLGVFWFLYRKMYGYAALLLISLWVISLILDLSLQAMGVNRVAISFISFFVSFAFSLVIGFKANGIYIHYAHQKITRILQITTDEMQRTAWIKKAGGTSLLVPWLAAGLFVLFIVLTGQR